MSQVFNVAVFGGGVVGGGCIKLLYSYENIRVKYLCVKNILKKRDFIINSSTIVTDNLDEVLSNKEINIYIELIGDTIVAKKIIDHALSKNIHVITGNKKLIAENLIYYSSLLNSSESKLGIEATVCGGIPIIKTLLRDFSELYIYSITGILNGTTNFILSKMSQDKSLYKDALLLAQKYGYAETDPTADIKGEDIRSKLVILTKIVFNIDIPINSIPITGIEDIETVDFEYSEFINSTIKMIGHAEQKNNEISLFITPTIISKNNQLSKVDGATNIVNINSENLGNTSLIGEGAGRYPTAQSVVSDVISIIKNTICNPFNMNKLNTELKFNTNYSSSFYIRFTVKEGIGIIYEISKICSNNLISIDSILQLPHEKENIDLVRFVIITEITTRTKIIDMIEQANNLHFNLKKPIFFPIMP